MSRKVLLCFGGVLSLACLALLVIGYAPEVFRAHNEALHVVVLAPKCDGEITQDVKLHFREPGFWASTTGTTLVVPEIGRCKSIWLSVTHVPAVVRLRSTEAVFKGEKHEVERVLTPQKTSSNSKIYEVSTQGLNKHWSLIINDGITARRTGFDRYAAAGVLSLSIGNWSLRTGNDHAYAVTGAQEWTTKVVSEDRPEDRDILFHTGAAFARITEHKDIFGILISNLLGLGLATLAQGVAMGADRRQARA